jgi:hypothetical protein
VLCNARGVEAGRHLSFAVAIAIATLAGCGGSGNERDAKPDSSGPRTLPSCAPEARGAVLPEGFPEDFPLPPGTVVRRASGEGGTLNVDALVPGDIRAATTFLLDELPSAGYELGEGDSEEHEAESHFSGNGFDGFFKLNTIGDCDGANTLAVVLSRS